MDFTFRIVFSGLCAFVPNRPFDPDPGNLAAYNAPNHVDVIFPRLLEPLPVLGGAEILDSHFPVLEFDPSTLVAIQGKIPVVDFERPAAAPKVARPRGMSLLIDEDLQIWPKGIAPSADTLSIKNGVPVNLQRPSTEDEKSYLWWLTKLDKAVGQPLKLKPQYLGGLKKEDPDIVTRVSLKGGKLSTLLLTKDHFEYRPLGALPNTGAYLQRVALKIALEMAVQEEVQIVLTDFGGGSSRSLSFAPSSSGGEVEVEIKSREAHDFLGIATPNANSSYDPDYAIYYNLTQPVDPPITPVLPHIAGGTGGAGYGKPCSPTGINAY